MPPRTLLAFVAILGVHLSPAVRAQSRPDIWRPITVGPWVGFTAYIPDAGSLEFQPSSFYRSVRGEISSEGVLQREPGSSSDLFELNLQAAVGITPRIALGAQPTFVVERERRNGVLERRSGLGQTQFWGQLVLVRETPAVLPELTFLALVKAPTATIPERVEAPERPSGSPDTWDVGGGLSLSKSLKPALLHLELTASQPLSERVSGGSRRAGPYAVWSAAVELASDRRPYALMVELTGLHQARTRFNRISIARSDSHELTIGAMLQVIPFPRVRLGLGVQQTLWGQNTSATSTAGATLGWVP